MRKSFNREEWILIHILIVVIIFSFTYLMYCIGIPNKDLIQNVVLFITAVAIFYYTYFTYELKNETKRQYEFNLRPIIIPYFRKEEDSGTSCRMGFKLKLRNEGRGAVIDLKLRITPMVENYKDIYPIGKNGQKEVCFSGKKEGDEKAVEILLYDQGEYKVRVIDNNDYLPSQLRQDVTLWYLKEWKINIEYTDINNDTWVTEAEKIEKIKEDEFIIKNIKIYKK